jgi:hypothetical protein
MPWVRETCAILMLIRGPADGRTVTSVTPRHVIVAVFLGGILVALAVVWSTFHAPVDRPWGWLYSSKQWNVVNAAFARRGFETSSVDVVTATMLANGQQFALLGARSNTGHSCVAVARGTAIGAPICRMSKPIVVFYARDTCSPCATGLPAKSLSVIGLIRGDVTVTSISQGRESGMSVIPSGIGFAFNSSFVRRGDRLRARNAAGDVLATITAGR